MNEAGENPVAQPSEGRRGPDPQRQREMQEKLAALRRGTAEMVVEVLLQRLTLIASCLRDGSGGPSKGGSSPPK